MIIAKVYYVTFRGCPLIRYSVTSIRGQSRFLFTKVNAAKSLLTKQLSISSPNVTNLFSSLISSSPHTNTNLEFFEYFYKVKIFNWDQNTPTNANMYKRWKPQLPCKNTQKQNKQKIRWENWGFVLVVRMSWTRYK